MDPIGILSSRIGIDAGHGGNIVIRGPEGLVPHGSTCLMHDESHSWHLPLRRWGNHWGSWWWIADTPADAPAGLYQVRCTLGDRVLAGDPLRIANEVLWESTWRHCAIGMPQRRQRFAKVKPGWFDAGMLWQEVNSHACFILGLCDVLEFRADQLGDHLGDQRAALIEQIIAGNTYLAACQDAATAHGHQAGGLCHDILDHQAVSIPGDMAKAAMAWAKAARLVGGTHAAEWRVRAAAALNWFHQAKPLQNFGFSPLAHGVTADYRVPATWRVEDLSMRLWAAGELAREDRAWLDHAAALAREMRLRQIPESAAEDGLWGHHWTFGDRQGPTQKAWTHCFYDGMGQDLGAVFPFWMVPLLELQKAFPEHPDAPRWLEAVHDLAYGFLLPACRRNPFSTCPMGVYPGEGLLDFSGFWHGGNAIYGYTAAQCLAFAECFNDAEFRTIAEANLQWIAGCNAGITNESLLACHAWSMDVPPDTALPASMICGIGDRTAGTWLATRGSICNGFGTGDQFRFDVPPARATDAPTTLSDEDWITHAGAWLSGISRLKLVH